jgi:carbon storage regulator
MLVLTRRLGEKIVLPTLGVTVQVVAIKGGAIRIGIEAPPDVKIVREELLSDDCLLVGSDQRRNEAAYR